MNRFFQDEQRETTSAQIVAQIVGVLALTLFSLATLFRAVADATGSVPALIFAGYLPIFAGVLMLAGAAVALILKSRDE